MALPDTKNLTFDKLRAGMSAKIVGCTECSEEFIRLQEMGMTEGATFQVVKVAPFGDPVEIDIRGYRLCLRKKENCAFLLEAEPEAAPESED